MWVKIDDGFYDHPKVREIGLEGAGLLVCLMSWSARHLTDGAIPHEVVRLLSGHHHRGNRLVQRLVTARCLDVIDEGTPPVYRIHDWDDYQDSARSVKERRTAAMQRKRRQRERERHSTGHAVTNDGNAGVSHPTPVPYPSRPKDFDLRENSLESVSNVLADRASRGRVSHEDEDLNVAERRHMFHVSLKTPAPDVCRFCAEAER